MRLWTLSDVGVDNNNDNVSGDGDNDDSRNDNDDWRAESISECAHEQTDYTALRWIMP